MITLRHKPFKIISFVFNWRIMALQCCIGFCHTSPWVSHRYTYDPSLVNPPPTSPHPLACCRAPGLSSLRRAANPHCWSTLPTVMYMFQRYSSSLSLPLLPPLCPQACSLGLCLPCSLFISPVFPDSTYLHLLDCVPLSDSSRARHTSYKIQPSSLWSTRAPTVGPCHLSLLALCLSTTNFFSFWYTLSYFWAHQVLVVATFIVVCGLCSLQHSGFLDEAPGLRSHDSAGLLAPWHVGS